MNVLMEVMIVMIKLYVRIQKVVIHVHVIKDTQELVSYVQVCDVSYLSCLFLLCEANILLIKTIKGMFHLWCPGVLLQL